MQNKVRILLLLAVLSILALTLVACGGGGEIVHTHTFGEWETVREATCSVTGLRRSVCSCGEEKVAIIPLVENHTLGEWETISEANCGTEGKKVQKCTVCGKEINTEETPATGEHSGFSWIVTEDKKYKEYTCGVCGYVEKRVQNMSGGGGGGGGTNPPAHTHSYGAWTATTAPTCTTAGEEQRTCSCGKKETRTVDPLGHDEVPHDAKAPTCTTIGWDAYVTCSRCDYSTYVEIAAKGHTEGEWVPNDAGTKLQMLCTICGEVIEEQFLITSEGLEFTLNDDGTGYIVSGLGSCRDAEIIIPATHNDFPVTEIGNYAFIEWTFLTSISIPKNVTKIGVGAFAYCSSLKNVEIHDNILEIGADAFANCLALESVKIGSAVKVIGDRAFRNCTSLKSISVSEFNEQYKSVDGNLYTKDEKTLIQYATGNNEVTISNSVTKIEAGAFSNSKISGIVIPASVTHIGNEAFSDCDYLKNVKMFETTINIGVNVFANCGALIYNEYGNAYYLGNDENPYVALVRVKSDSITSCDIHENTKIIYPNAFYYCTSLASIVIPDNVTSIGDEAFYGCDVLGNVTIGKSVSKLGNGVFSYSHSISCINVSLENAHYKSVDGNLYTKDGKTLIQYAVKKAEKAFAIPNGVTTIGSYAFNGCASLENVEITNSVITIEEGAFFYMPSLKSVSISSGVESIGEKTFSLCYSLTNIEVSEYNKNYKSIDGNLYNKDGTELIQYAIGKADTSFAVPDGVITIGNRAFHGCKALTSVTIPNSVQNIGEWAFVNCFSLTSIEIPNSVVTIGSYAFLDCYSLTIYCEPANQPNGWNSEWNPSNCPTVWEHTK